MIPQKTKNQYVHANTHCEGKEYKMKEKVEKGVCTQTKKVRWIFRCIHNSGHLLHLEPEKMGQKSIELSGILGFDCFL